jgi:DNA adenine methylase
VEPFVGGANLIKHVPAPCIGYDNNPYLIALHKAIQKGWAPEEKISKDMYNAIRKNKSDYPKELVGFCGVYHSFGGKWFGSFARSEGRCYYEPSLNDLKKMQKETSHVVFEYTKTYEDIVLPKNCIIYCDPPYQTPKKEKFYFENDFDFEVFKNWMLKKSNEGHEVFFPEYLEIKEEWCSEVFSKELGLQINNNNGAIGRTRIERLYKVNKDNNG